MYGDRQACIVKGAELAKADTGGGGVTSSLQFYPQPS